MGEAPPNKASSALRTRPLTAFPSEGATTHDSGGLGVRCPGRRGDGRHGSCSCCRGEVASAPRMRSRSSAADPAWHYPGGGTRGHLAMGALFALDTVYGGCSGHARLMPRSTGDGARAFRGADVASGGGDRALRRGCSAAMERWTPLGCGLCLGVLMWWRCAQHGRTTAGALPRRRRCHGRAPCRPPKARRFRG